MTPLAISAMIVQLATKIIELRLEHYKVKPELREQDAENAVILGTWGNKLLKAVERLFVEMEKTQP